MVSQFVIMVIVRYYNKVLQFLLVIRSLPHQYGLFTLYPDGGNAIKITLILFIACTTYLIVYIALEKRLKGIISSERII